MHSRILFMFGINCFSGTRSRITRIVIGQSNLKLFSFPIAALVTARNERKLGTRRERSLKDTNLEIISFAFTVSLFLLTFAVPMHN